MRKGNKQTSVPGTEIYSLKEDINAIAVKNGKYYYLYNKKYMARIRTTIALSSPDIKVSMPAQTSSYLNTSMNFNLFEGIDQTTMKYLQEKGYTILEYHGLDQYILDTMKLTNLPYMQQWGVQKINAADYIGKEISIYFYTIENHPLDNVKSNEKHQTYAFVMVCEGQIIGGYSIPNDDSNGGFYDIDGKTLEEVTGQTLWEWMAEWNNKYR